MELSLQVCISCRLCSLGIFLGTRSSGRSFRILQLCMLQVVHLVLLLACFWKQFFSSPVHQSWRIMQKLRPDQNTGRNLQLCQYRRCLLKISAPLMFKQTLGFLLWVPESVMYEL